ncbi:SDR family NAD(P)-dependent oxidoreductase [Brevundimonas sp.]|uniref:SDR family NAD(P)-dependent oxidoreductase n=1 Tax=Brevundimonas sp. TaxID=1871086 RepID=UPI0026241E01|nr:SDR family oxidoreductase [Brevundimonas sp.]
MPDADPAPRATYPGVCLVTGAASGIGAATARRLATDGAKALVLVDRNGGALRALGDELEQAYGVALYLCHQDILSEEGWDGIEHGVTHHWGGLDTVVINAGVSDAGSIAGLSLEAWRSVVSVNLDGTFLTLRTAMRLLRDGGAAVVVSSASAVKAEPGTAAYGASKAAGLQLARVAAKEGAARGIRINAILPGGVETPIWQGVPAFNELVTEAGSEQAAFDRMAGFATPLGHYAKPDEIAGQIAFLLSPAARSMTGSALVVDGGYML